MAKPNPQVAAHLEWLGFVKPTGLVVSPTALVRAGAILNRRDAEGQDRLRECIDGYDSESDDSSSSPALPSFPDFARAVLGWSFSPKGYAGTKDSPLPSKLEATMLDSGETVRPRYAVRMGAGESEWQLLVLVVKPGGDFERGEGSRPSPHATMERLLRNTGVPAGLLFNGEALRLVSAPKGESSGWLDFRVADMMETAGRPICTAMRLLLSEKRLLAASKDKRLAALMADSRKFQNEVSQELSEQVLHALYELLRGFQAAHDASGKQLLARFLDPNWPRDDRGDPDEVYRGLLTLVLRLIFVLYAEERDLLPQGEVFLDAYSVAGLHRRLREDAALHPDTMDQRYGAYAQLLFLFRMIHDGAHIHDGAQIIDGEQSDIMILPPRRGALFDPDRYRFLEGRSAEIVGGRQVGQAIEPPRVSDGTIYRVLEKLLVLKGERISYRALDVEHIGSVYETMMGFRLETAEGRSVAIKAAKPHGAPATVDLDELLAEPPGRRAKWIRDHTDRAITGNKKVSTDVRQADTIEALHAVLAPIVDTSATPDLVAPGSLVLQPSEERRRSGSHYTPRELTEPIVRDTLKPLLDRLRNGPSRAPPPPPPPEKILSLKVCDPAMGSGAFLVEACRQLGTVLVESWHHHGTPVGQATGEDELVLARREVARRCLYGVDRNPVAVDLAKLSLWLATLAKKLSFTFLDHALRHGDSLVGLTNKQIDSLHWKAHARTFEPGLEAVIAQEQLARAKELRRRIREAGEDVSDRESRDMLDEAESATAAARQTGDLVMVAFFEEARQREKMRARFAEAVMDGRADEYASDLETRRDADPPLAPFHWEIEFLGVFDRENPGFDAIVGNPPFGGHVTVVASNIAHYTTWLRYLHPGSAGKCDVVAHFFRRSFSLLRQEGYMGLLATNTISQGYTRASGLQWICENGGTIFRVMRRVPWPGIAAVIVSMVHIGRTQMPLATKRWLDGRPVDDITAFLFHRGGHVSPAVLSANDNKSFQGSTILGMGFTFDDTEKRGIATSIANMNELLTRDNANSSCILPYIGGSEINSHPAQRHHRYVIQFADFPRERRDTHMSWMKADTEQQREMKKSGIVPLDYPHPVAADWPDLLAIVVNKVRPERQRAAAKSKSSHGVRAAKYWWQHYHQAHNLYSSIKTMDRIVVVSQVSQHATFTFLSTRMVYASGVIVFPLDTHAAFCALQSRVHELWARFFGSSMKDDLCYTPSDVFETFPFPENWTTHPALESVGKEYYEFRAKLMVQNDEGLTKTYNRFHDPNEHDPKIARLRELHAAMDRAVLDAYGWTELSTECKFLLDYEIDEQEWGRKKKPYRYRWPDDVRDEVLARLLELNSERAAQERRSQPKHGGRQ